MACWRLALSFLCVVASAEAECAPDGACSSDKTIDSTALLQSLVGVQRAVNTDEVVTQDAGLVETADANVADDESGQEASEDKKDQEDEEKKVQEEKGVQSVEHVEADDSKEGGSEAVHKQGDDQEAETDDEVGEAGEGSEDGLDEAEDQEEKEEEENSEEGADEAVLEQEEDEQEAEIDDEVGEAGGGSEDGLDDEAEDEEEEVQGSKVGMPRLKEDREDSEGELEGEEEDQREDEDSVSGEQDGGGVHPVLTSQQKRHISSFILANDTRVQMVHLRAIMATIVPPKVMSSHFNFLLEEEFTDGIAKQLISTRAPASSKWGSTPAVPGFISNAVTGAMCKAGWDICTCFFNPVKAFTHLIAPGLICSLVPAKISSLVYIALNLIPGINLVAWSSPLDGAISWAVYKVTTTICKRGVLAGASKFRIDRYFKKNGEKLTGKCMKDVKKKAQSIQTKLPLNRCCDNNAGRCNCNRRRSAGDCALRRRSGVSRRRRWR